MEYVVFENATLMAEANGLWLLKRYEEGYRDSKNGKAVDPQVTSSWDFGRVMLDGRIACQVPEDEILKIAFMNTDGIILDLTVEDFPSIEGNF